MLTAVAVLAIFVYGLISPMLGALLPGYALNGWQQGALTLTNALGLVIACLSAGPLVDLKGKRPALLLGLGLATLALFALPRAGGYAALLAEYFTLGVGGGIVMTGANALVSDISPSRRGPALNFLNLFFGLGGIVTTFAASYIFAPVTLCYSIAGLAVLALLASVAVPVPNSSGAISFEFSEVPKLAGSHTLILLSLLLFLYVACEVGVWNWLKAYLLDAKFDARTAGGIVSYGFGFGILLGRLLASRMPAKVSGLKLLLAASLFITITTFLMLQISSNIGVTFAVFFTGLAMAPVFPTTLAIVGDSFPRGRATAMGMAITSGWLGLAVSSPVIGFVADRRSLHDALFLLPVFSTVMVLVSMVLMSVLRKRDLK